MTLKEFIKSSDYIITQEDIIFINKQIERQFLNEQRTEFYKEADQFGIIDIEIKGWDDYDGEEYHFHSPPDCMYMGNDNGGIHAEIIDQLGGSTFEAYELENSFEVFIGDEENIKISLPKWGVKYGEK